MSQRANEAVLPPRSGRTGIFIAYRRSDSKPWAGRLAKDLRSYFGRDYVYLDIDSNLPGQDYVAKIERWLANIRVVLVIIGPQWSSQVNERGERRIDDPSDLHRRELELSLASGAAVLPVVVGGGQVPAAGNLPDSIRAISRLEQSRMPDDDWDYHLGRLLDVLAARGVRPIKAKEPAAAEGWTPETTRRFSRTMRASRRLTFDALVVTADKLKYRRVASDAELGQLSFEAIGRSITAKVIDAGPGMSSVMVEVPTVKGGVAGGTAALFLLSIPPLVLPALAALPLLRAWEKRFAVGFLSNVESVLDGRGVIADSALFPGLEKWRNRITEV